MPIVEKHVANLRHLDAFALTFQDLSEDAIDRLRGLVPGTAEIDHSAFCIPAAYNPWPS